MTSFSLTRRQALAGAGAAALIPSTAWGVDANAVLNEALAGTAVPGMAAIVIRNFHAEREIVAGVRRIGGDDQIRRGDRWYLGSDAKAMTATLIAILAEQGVLSWQTPLSEMLPALASTMLPEYRDLTLPDLLSHRTGISPDIADFDLFVSFFEDPAPLSTQRQRYIAVALSRAPVAPKRAEHLYSNTNYYIAAAIVEHATGQEFEALMERLVFAPLRMRSVTREPIAGPREPIGHVNGRVADRFGTASSDLEPPMGSPSAGGIRLSMRDWARFCIDQMHGEHGNGRLLRNTTYRYLHTPQGDTRYALGWVAQQSVYGRRGPAIYHSGSDGNWIAEAVLFPRIGDGVLVCSNSAYGMDGNTTAETVARRVCQTLSEAVEPPPA